MTYSSLVTSTLAATLAIAFTSAVAAQDVEILRVAPPEVPGDIFYNRDFGNPLELEDGWLFTTDLVAGPGGEVYFYRETGNGWALEQTIGGTQDGASGFGLAIDADGGRLAVGFPAWKRGPSGPFTGRVEVFELQPTGQWMRTAEIAPAGIFCPRTFGQGVALSGDTLAVIARDTCSLPRRARIHVYTIANGTWSRQETITFVPPPVLFQQSQISGFGTSLALEGDTLVAGVSHFYGGALVYRRSGTDWSRVALLLDPETIEGDLMGNSVAIEGSTIVVGSPATFPVGGSEHSGAATVFEEVAPDQWVKTARLRPSDPFSSSDFGDAFGTSVAVDGDEIVVGSPRGRGPGSTNPGKVYYFHKGPAGWPMTETGTFAFRVSRNGDRLGTAVDTQKGLVVAGMPGFSGSGWFLLFGVGQGTAFCTTVANSTGVAASLRTLGSDAASDETLILAASEAPAGATGGFFVSAGPASHQLFNGFLCLAAPITRLGPPVQADQAGEAIQRVGIDSIMHLWAPASTLYVQYWHTDTIGQLVGLSNAVSLTLR